MGAAPEKAANAASERNPGVRTADQGLGDAEQGRQLRPGGGDELGDLAPEVISFGPECPDAGGGGSQGCHGHAVFDAAIRIHAR